MIWIVEIPVIVLVIAAMLIGSVEIGGTLRVVGAVLSALGAYYLVRTMLISKTTPDRSLKKKRNRFFGMALLLGIQGVVVLLIGIWFGEHSIFEFLFGTGWF